PGVRNEEQPDYLQNLEGSLKARAKVWQLQIESSAPLEFNQNKGWKLSGARGQWRKRWSMIGFHRDRRGFVLWCEFTEPSLEGECSKAFVGLEIKEQAPELAGPTELREGFVLDDPQVGCT